MPTRSGEPEPAGGARASDTAMADESTEGNTSPDDTGGTLRPKLRRVEQIESTHEGAAVVILRDPLGVAESFALDQEFVPVLGMLDGSRTTAQVAQSLRMRGVLTLETSELAAFVASLEDSGWLEGEAFRQLWAEQHGSFLEDDPRSPRFAGIAYPADAEGLAACLATAVTATPISPGTTVCGVLVPHDLGPSAHRVLHQTLRGLPPRDELDVVVVMGTDHGPGLLPYAVARRGFQTPQGVTPAAYDILDALERRVQWAFREEVRHRAAMSVELAAVLLQAVYGPNEAPPIVPLLCGPAVLQARHEELRDTFLAGLDAVLDGQRVLFWGSAELSHAGVAYGRPALTVESRAELLARDESCLHDLVYAKRTSLASRCAEVHPQGRPSGGPVLATLRELMPDARAERVDYELREHPDAPGEVGFAGVRFHRRS